MKDLSLSKTKLCLWKSLSVKLNKRKRQPKLFGSGDKNRMPHGYQWNSEDHQWTCLKLGSQIRKPRRKGSFSRSTRPKFHQEGGHSWSRPVTGNGTGAGTVSWINKPPKQRSSLCQKLTPIHLISFHKIGGWRDVSMVNSKSSASLRPGFHSQHVRVGAQRSVTSVQGHIVLSSVLQKHQACTWCTYIHTGQTFICIDIINPRKISSWNRTGKDASKFIL